MIPLSPEGGLLLSLARACAVAGEISVFGTLTFGLVVLPRALRGADVAVADVARATLLRLVRVSIVAALIGAGLWLVAQTADLSSATSLGMALAAVPDVLGGTEFGHVLALQMLVLVAILPVLSRPRLAFGFGLAALALQAGHSHALSMQPGFSLVVNRYRLAPALRGGDPVGAKWTLIRSIAVQTGFGLAIVVAAGVLSNLPPSLHEQPV